MGLGCVKLITSSSHAKSLFVGFITISYYVPTQAEQIMRGIFMRGKHKLSTFRFPSAFTDKSPGYVVHKQV